MSQAATPLLNRKAQVAFGSAVVILIAVGAFAYRSLVLVTESGRWVRHSHEVLENLQELRYALQSIESSTRGFALTGEDSYLRSHRATVSSVQNHAAAVRELTADNPEQQRRLPALEELAAQKIQYMETIRNGAYEYLSKPLDKAELLAAVHRALKNGKQTAIA